MQLILVDDVIHLGRRGKTVTVASGYGRNYLIPKGLAIPATSANIKIVEQQKISLARKESKIKENAEILSQEITRLHLVFSRKAGETGALFGSVTAKDLTDLLEQKGFTLDRRKIELEQPLKTIGNFPIPTYLHPEIRVELLVSVMLEESSPFAKVLERDSEESPKIIDNIENQILEAKKVLEAQKEALASEAEEASKNLASMIPEETGNS